MFLQIGEMFMLFCTCFTFSRIYMMVSWLVVVVVSLTTKLSITDITISVDSILLMLLQLLITPEFLRASGTLVRIYSVRVFLMLSIVDQSAKLPIAIIACLWDSILLMSLPLLIRSEFHWASDTFVGIYSMCIFLMVMVVNQTTEIQITDITTFVHRILLVFW